MLIHVRGENKEVYAITRFKNLTINTNEESV